MINISLRCKDNEIQTTRCEVISAVDLPHDEFESFRTNLLHEYPFIADHADEMSADSSGVHRCILVLDSGNDDGIDTSKCSNETIITIMSAIAQEESVSISQNMRWSYQKRMQSGEYITTYAPLGYDMSDGKLVIYPEEADMVKQIFQMFLRGMGMNMICEALNGRLSMWGVHYVLTNEKYMGDALVQKSYTTETLPFIRKTNRGEVDQYYIYDTQEPIISRTDFYRVQAILNERRNTFYSLSSMEQRIAFIRGRFKRD